MQYQTNEIIIIKFFLFRCQKILKLKGSILLGEKGKDVTKNLFRKLVV